MARKAEGALARAPSVPEDVTKRNNLSSQHHLNAEETESQEANLGSPKLRLSDVLHVDIPEHIDETLDLHTWWEPAQRCTKGRRMLYLKQGRSRTLPCRMWDCPYCGPELAMDKSWDLIRNVRPSYLAIVPHEKWETFRKACQRADTPGMAVRRKAAIMVFTRDEVHSKVGFVVRLPDELMEDPVRLSRLCVPVPGKRVRKLDTKLGAGTSDTNEGAGGPPKPAEESAFAEAGETHPGIHATTQPMEKTIYYSAHEELLPADFPMQRLVTVLHEMAPSLKAHLNKDEINFKVPMTPAEEKLFEAALKVVQREFGQSQPRRSVTDTFASSAKMSR